MTARYGGPGSRVLAPRLRSIAGSRLPLFVLGFCLAYFLAAKLGIATSLPPEGIVILWPPNAIVLATLLSTKPRQWWVFFAATVATEVAADLPDYPLAAAIGYGVVNFSEAALAATLLRRLGTAAAPLARVRDFIAFVVCGPVLASGTAALLGAAIYKLGAPDLSYLHYWRVFWFGDALGLLIVGTALLVWRDGRLAAWTPSRILEGALLGLGLLALALWVFGDPEPDQPRIYLLFPFLLWSALRFGPRGAATIVLMTTGAAVWAAVNDLGPFAELSTIDNVLSLQGLLAVVALSTLTTAFAVEELQRVGRSLRLEVERRQAAEAQLQRSYRQLEQTNADLDRRVALRTQELREALARNAVLLQEVHHRVKNNLQLVSSMLWFHGRSVEDPAAREKFRDVQEQIAAIAGVYELIYRTEHSETVDFRELLHQLCERVSSGAGPHVRISVEAEDEAPLPAGTAASVALAVNELMTNSVKHAGGAVALAVRCRRAGGRIVIRIADDGPGFPPDFDLAQAASFGLRITRELVQQADGAIAIRPSDSGAVIEIAVPLTG